MNNFYEIKNINLVAGDIKDIDLKSRTVTGYFSHFGNVDHDGDMIMPGSFKKSISERGNLIPHLADHMMNTENLLSRPKLYEKADGGFFESTIIDTTKGTDVLKQYRDNLINQHSFGYKTMRSKSKVGYKEVQEVMLYEISSVVLGANEKTPFSGFKSLSKPELLDRYNLLKKCYRDGNYSDEFFPVLQAQMKQVEQELLKTIVEKTEKFANNGLETKLNEILKKVVPQ